MELLVVQNREFLIIGTMFKEGLEAFLDKIFDLNEAEFGLLGEGKVRSNEIFEIRLLAVEATKNSSHNGDSFIWHDWFN